jgi:hypothetical protein
MHQVTQRRSQVLHLIGMVEQLAGRPACQKRSDHMMSFFACQARVVVEANRAMARIEALYSRLPSNQLRVWLRRAGKRTNPNND